MSIVVSGRYGGVDPFFDIRGMLLGLRWCVFGARVDQVGIVVALIYESLVPILYCSTVVIIWALVRL